MTRRLARISRTIPTLPTNRRRVSLTDEERDFLVQKRANGLSAVQAQRMFFRRFGRDISSSTAQYPDRGEPQMFESKRAVPYTPKPFPGYSASIALANLGQEEWDAIEKRIVELKCVNRSDYLRRLIAADLGTPA